MWTLIRTVAIVALLSCACSSARVLLQDPTNPAFKATGAPCTVGPAGNQFCASKGQQQPPDQYKHRYVCAPLRYLYPQAGYNSTAGVCAQNQIDADQATLGPVLPLFNFTYENFTYQPQDNFWDRSTQKAFLAEERCNDQTKNSPQGCTLTYNKATTTSTSTTFSQSLSLEADFTFKVGGCALCPAEADTTFKVTAGVGFQENFQNSSTTGFSASVTSNPPPGNCTVAVFSVNYLQDFQTAFEMNVQAVCQEGVVPFGDFNSPFVLIPCTDIAASLALYPGNTAKVLSVQGDGNGPAAYAQLQLSGSQTVSFGTSVNTDVCDCSDQACIAKARANANGAGSNAGAAVNVNAAALPRGVAAADIGKAKPLPASEQTCDNCITRGGPGAPARAPASGRTAASG